MDKITHTLINTAIETRQQYDKNTSEKNELWVCDDNFTHTSQNIDPAIFNPIGHTFFITNRVDTHTAIGLEVSRQSALQTYPAYCYLSDFNFADMHLNKLKNNRLDAVYFRIAKEKALSHYIINQAIAHLNDNGRLILVGQKSEGIKGYADRLKKLLKLPISLEKNGDIYIVTYIKSTTNKTMLKAEDATQLDDQHYTEFKAIHELDLSTHGSNIDKLTIHSKPGVYGWKKFDAGTQLLLHTLLKELDINTIESALDLGCGSGVIALALKHLGINNVVATDNNITAIMATQHNALLHALDIKIIKDDCAKSIDQNFNLVLCNPPFHKGFDTHSPLTTLFVEQAMYKLYPKGEAWFVVNSFVPIEKNINVNKATYKTIINNKQFKIIRIIKK